MKVLIEFLGYCISSFHRTAYDYLLITLLVQKLRDVDSRCHTASAGPFRDSSGLLNILLLTWTACSQEFFLTIFYLLTEEPAPTRPTYHPQ